MTRPTITKVRMGRTSNSETHDTFCAEFGVDGITWTVQARIPVSRAAEFDAAVEAFAGIVAKAEGGTK